MKEEEEEEDGGDCDIYIVPMAYTSYSTGKESSTELDGWYGMFLV